MNIPPKGYTLVEDERPSEPSPRLTTHPLLVITPARAKIWTEQATDDDFMNHLNALANIYAGRKHRKNPKTELNTLKLFTDFREWLKTNGD